MYNLRYHIASLVGVFLALAIGLVLGGLVVGQGTLESQQASLVEGLRKEFATLRTENQMLSTQNDVLSEYSKMMTDSWVAGRLNGRSTVLLTNAGRSDGLKASTEAIRAAGGTVVTVTLGEDGLDLASSEIQSIVASATGEPAGSAEKTAAVLQAEWTSTGDVRPLSDALVEAGILDIEGLSSGTAASGIVDLAAPDAEPDEAALAIARSFADEGLPAVGGQTLLRDTGVAVASASAGMSALDTLGTDIGAYTLVALLSGATPGYYGQGEAATAAYPQLPQP